MSAGLDRAYRVTDALIRVMRTLSRSERLMVLVRLARAADYPPITMDVDFTGEWSERQQLAHRTILSYEMVGLYDPADWDM